MSGISAVQTGVIRTKVPSRLDRLPRGRFHWLVILGLGTAWILDGDGLVRRVGRGTYAVSASDGDLSVEDGR